MISRYSFFHLTVVIMLIAALSIAAVGCVSPNIDEPVDSCSGGVCTVPSEQTSDPIPSEPPFGGVDETEDPYSSALAMQKLYLLSQTEVSYDECGVSGMFYGTNEAAEAAFGDVGTITVFMLTYDHDMQRYSSGSLYFTDGFAVDTSGEISSSVFDCGPEGSVATYYNTSWQFDELDCYLFVVRSAGKVDAQSLKAELSFQGERKSIDVIVGEKDLSCEELVGIADRFVTIDGAVYYCRSVRRAGSAAIWTDAEGDTWHDYIEFLFTPLTGLIW